MAGHSSPVSLGLPRWRPCRIPDPGEGTLSQFPVVSPPPHRLNIDRCISCVRVRTNVILAGKCDSHRHSSTSFSENVVVAKTSYQMLQILSFIDRERAFSFKGNKRSNFRGEKKYDAFRGVYF